MPFSLGNNNITKIYLGTNEVQKIYLGNTQVYGRQWTPADITTLAWYDADDASTITLNGSNVSQWDDKSGNDHHLAQATAARQATYAPTGFNGRPTITPDGVDDTYINNGVGLALGSSDFFMFLVCRSTSTGMQVCASAPGTRMYMQINANQMQVRWGSDPSPITSFNVGPGEDRILAWSRTNGNTVRSFTDGTMQVSDTASFVRSYLYFSIFSFTFSNSTSTYANGSTSELVITPPLSATDRQKMEGYLAHKWGLTSNMPENHPYKTTAPIV